MYLLFWLLAQTPIEWTISGLHCDSCLKTIRKHVCQKEKLSQCEIEWISQKDQTGRLVFQCPSGTDCSGQIRKTIEKLGYKVNDQLQ